MEIFKACAIHEFECDFFFFFLDLTITVRLVVYFEGKGRFIPFELSSLINKWVSLVPVCHCLFFCRVGCVEVFFRNFQTSLALHFRAILGSCRHLIATGFSENAFFPSFLFWSRIRSCKMRI